MRAATLLYGIAAAFSSPVPEIPVASPHPINLDVYLPDLSYWTVDVGRGGSHSSVECFAETAFGSELNTWIKTEKKKAYDGYSFYIHAKTIIMIGLNFQLRMTK
ncbi:hypothetical protein BD560DRAFT_427512 [Blakeslea trispora]|nr:hypothetical protein BD560DRAFT_427512 [Blakeslea trispora]